MSLRVLDPHGAPAHLADRLDPVAPLRDGERRLVLDALVLGPSGDALRTPADPRAGLLHALQDRGGLPAALHDGALVGLVDGRRTVVIDRLAGVAAWVVDLPGWDGVAAVVPADGHAVLGAAHQVWTVPDDVPSSTGPGDLVDLAWAARAAAVAGEGRGRLAVLGDDPAAVAGAVRGAGAAGRPVVATAATLGTARALQELGARVVVAAGGTVADQRDRLAAELADLAGGGPATVLLVGRRAPARPGDGPGSSAWEDVAGTIAPSCVVEVLGVVQVERVVAGGTDVVLRGGTAADGGGRWA